MRERSPSRRRSLDPPAPSARRSLDPPTPSARRSLGTRAPSAWRLLGARREVDLELARRGKQRLAGGAGPAALDPVTDHLAAAATVEVDSPIGRLDREASRRRTRHHRVKAPAFAVDLDDVAWLDALESHCRTHSSRIARAMPASIRDRGLRARELAMWGR